MTPSLDQSTPYSTFCTCLTNDSLHDTFHHSNALKGKVHRTLWWTLLQVIRATQSLSWWTQILETRPATAHPRWQIIQPSQVYCKTGCLRFGMKRMYYGGTIGLTSWRVVIYVEVESIEWFLKQIPPEQKFSLVMFETCRMITQLWAESFA